MKRFASVVLFPLIPARRSLTLMRAVRALYHAPRLRRFQRLINFLFDPGSIRRHSRRAIPARYVSVKGKLGERLRVNLGDHIGWHLFLNGYFDLVPSLVALVLHRADKGGVYLDVGANIGDTSIAVANRGVNTVGIDASAMAISDLCHNIALNSPIPYTVVHAAVCSTSAARSGDVEADYVKLHVPMGNSGAASVHSQWNPAKNISSAMLAYPRSISDIVDALSIRSLCCIKLDVEGAEHEALRGMNRILREYRCPVMFEYRIDHLADVGLEASSIVDLLPEGYECFSITCDRIQGDCANLKISDFDPNQSYENVLGVYRTVPPILQAARSSEGMKVPFDSIDGECCVDRRSRCA